MSSVTIQDDEAIQHIVQEIELASNSLEKNRIYSDHERSDQQTGTVSSQYTWATTTLSSHHDVEQLGFGTVIAGPETGLLINPLQSTLLNDPLINDTDDELRELSLGSDVDFDAAFPPFPVAFPLNSADTTTDYSTVSAEVLNEVLLNEVPPMMDDFSPISLVNKGPMQKTMVVKPVTISLPAKIRRKRNSGILEEPPAAPSPAPLDCSSSSGKRGKKKVKLYEKPDKNDPLVQRAGYAKSYREKKKHENETLKRELEVTKKDLEAENAKKAKLEKEVDEYRRREEVMKTKISQKDKEIGSLKEALKEEQEKNALNPQQTEEILKSIHGVVKAACPKNVKTVSINVSETLAKKKSAALGQDRMKAICAEENLRNQRCTFTFEIDDMNKLTIEKQ